ncbi:MAG: DUF6175 family protein [Candidatus Cloacimonetes bacterium]|nr:DUF6175 family protein [Candidatus Cloacimonadota bacterium]
MNKKTFLWIMLVFIFSIVSINAFTDTITDFPWIENFSNTPTNWTRWTGNLSNYSILQPYEGGWIEQSNWDLRNFGNNSNHANGQSTSILLQNPRAVWLITPTIVLPSSGEHILTFDIAHTHSDNTWSASATNSNFFSVIISTDNGNTWSVDNTIARWDQQGSPRTISSIPTTGETVILDIKDYSGPVKFAFYAQATQNGNRIHIDNVAVRQTRSPEISLPVVIEESMEATSLPTPIVEPPPTAPTIPETLETQPVAEIHVVPHRPEGLTHILILPETSMGNDPLDLLRNNQAIRQTVSFLERYLTSYDYDLIMLQTAQYQSILTNFQSIIGNRPDENLMRLALVSGADIYLTFEQQITNVGGGSQRFSFTIRAFETTSGRLLGTETENAQGTSSEIVENTINKAIDDLMTTVVNNWIASPTQGQAFRLVITINSMYREDEARNIHNNFDRVIREITTSVNRNSASRQYMDYAVWANTQSFSDSDSFFRELKNRYDRAAYRPSMNSTNISRKLLILSID